MKSVSDVCTKLVLKTYILVGVQRLIGSDDIEIERDVESLHHEASENSKHTAPHHDPGQVSEEMPSHQLPNVLLCDRLCPP